MRKVLREAREAKGLSQADVAAAAGVDRVTYLHVESGRDGVSLALALVLSDILGVDVRAAFGDVVQRWRERRKPA